MYNIDKHLLVCNVAQIPNAFHSPSEWHTKIPVPQLCKTITYWLLNMQYEQQTTYATTYVTNVSEYCSNN